MDQSTKEAFTDKRDADRRGEPHTSASLPRQSSKRVPKRDITTWTTKLFPVLRALVDSGYFSYTVEGLEDVPETGAVIYVANHAGWLTVDTMFLALSFFEHNAKLERLPWIAANDKLLASPIAGQFFAPAGAFPASWLRTPHEIPPEIEQIIIYPEGTEGNCKSFLQAYRMQEWRLSFLRLALARGAKIVPVAIVGGEECAPSLGVIRFLKPLLGTILPVPLFLLPLPSRWKFIFHKPVDISELNLNVETNDPENQKRRFREIADSIQGTVQRTIDRETSDHGLARLSRLIEKSLG